MIHLPLPYQFGERDKTRDMTTFGPVPTNDSVQFEQWTLYHAGFDGVPITSIGAYRAKQIREHNLSGDLAREFVPGWSAEEAKRLQHVDETQRAARNAFNSVDRDELDAVAAAVQRLQAANQ